MALIPDDPKQRNALIVGILAAAAFYFFWSMWYSPTNLEVEEMTARLEQLEQQNRIGQIQATRGGTDLEELLARYERHVVKLEALIPQSEEVSALLNDISTVARQTGVQDAVLRPEADEVGAFYTKESYRMEVVGDYHAIGRFLTDIASLPRIITPVELEITPFQGDQFVFDMEFPLTARLRIQTYILPEAAVVAPVEGGEGQQGG